MKNNSFSRISTAATHMMILCGLLALGVSAMAQSNDAQSQAGRLQGAWRVQVTVRDCQTGAALRTFPAMSTFAKGGTLTVVTAGQFPALATTGLGVWRHTGGDTYSAVSESFVLAPPARGRRHTGSRGPSRSVTTRTSSPIQLRSKSLTPTAP
jgi:hypothetical protein